MAKRSEKAKPCPPARAGKPRADSRRSGRLRRSESFLGIHFDFHAGRDCTGIGEMVTRKMIGDIVRKVKPDYVQCDCKGHPGLSSYPTKVGHPAPGFVRDQLRIWREVTAAHGVALYVHYSGVIDSEAVTRHPEWARMGPDGKPDDGTGGGGRSTSVFGRYADELLIPQLLELRDEYGVDGVWVDGECWGAELDYGENVLAAFREATGIDSVPKVPADPGFLEFCEFNRQGFRKYLAHYVDALHGHDPGFQIASNWAYSHQMPERVTANVDYISGDYSMSDSVNSARFAGRVMTRQGRPWDLMAWSFTSRWREGAASTKTVPQLCQEAAIVLALGGGFQAYFKQKRDGSIEPWTAKLMAETAKFCRARQEFCHGAELVPQVGLVLSTEAYYRKSEAMFRPRKGEYTPLHGVLRSLLENQHSVEVLMEHQLEGRMDEYPLVVLPEWEYLPPGFRHDLVAYVKGGGRLLVIGPRCAALFREELGVRFDGEPEVRARWLEHKGWLGGVKAETQAVELGRAARQFGRLYAENDFAGRAEPAASVTRLGKGMIAATYFSLGERYAHARTAVLRDFLGALARRLFPRPAVEVAGSHLVDVTLTRKDGRLMVNLVNTAGPHADENVYTFDEIPPVGPLEITIRPPGRSRKPKRLTLEPRGERLRFTWRQGEARCTLPRLGIHDIIAVE